MKIIQKSAVLVRPKQLFNDWAISIASGKEDEGMTPDGEDGTVYLINRVDFLEPGYLRDRLERYWIQIAASEFEAWHTIPADWPVMTSFDDFERYFHWEVRSSVEDLDGGSLIEEEERFLN
ncbi:MAG: hypothetical protein P1U89_27145 [Verrucomicrobiales bacterium]|nr:hypothetical protein [Verrucomicrobiales bacterium]